MNNSIPQNNKRYLPHELKTREIQLGVDPNYEGGLL